MKQTLFVGILIVFAVTGCTSMHKSADYYYTGSASRNMAGTEAGTRAGLPGWLSTSDNAALWNQYCIGPNTDPSVIPQPNYNNEFMKNKVIPKLLEIDDRSYYLYGDVLEVYGLRDSITKKLVKPAYSIPQGITLTTNAFLVYLCGEFRDRATLVEEKLKWLSKLYKLPVKGSHPFDASVPPFAQLTAEKYPSYLALSRAVFTARQPAAKAALIDLGKDDKGNSRQVQSATDGFTVCTVKYMMAKYILPGKTYDSSFESGLLTWGADPANCRPEDHHYYYDFRGDSNFKPNSPESNAMIWAGTTMAKMCSNPVKSKDETKVTSAECRDYFTRPFESRWNKARQGEMTWLFYAPEYQSTFENTKALTVLYPNTPPSIGGENGPLKYNFTLGDTKNLIDKYNVGLNVSLIDKPDMGFNNAFGGSKFEAYRRIQQSVDRHTDWYASGYDDQRGKTMNNSYSPFVASSYEPSSSDAFIACGYTVPCGKGPLVDKNRQWMFVFKIHENNWYRTQDIGSEKKSVDFARDWFDETSFGTSDLSQSEHAFDRLGTAMEGEYEAIMYVHNMVGGAQTPIPGGDNLKQDDPYLVAKGEVDFVKAQQAPPPPAPVFAAHEGPQPGLQPPPVVGTMHKVVVAPMAPPPDPKKVVFIKELQLAFERPETIPASLKGKDLYNALVTAYQNHIAPHLPSGVTAEIDSKVGVKDGGNTLTVKVKFKPSIDKLELNQVLIDSKLKVTAKQEKKAL